MDDRGPLDEDLDLIRRMRSSDEHEDSRREALSVLNQRYDGILRHTARSLRVSASEVETHIESVWTTVVQGTDFPTSSTSGWLCQKLTWDVKNQTRSNARRERVLKGAASNLDAAGRIATRRPRKRTRREPPATATPFRPLWLVPSWLEEDVRAFAQGDELRTWELVNGDPGELRDILSFAPVVLGPVSDAIGAHPIIRFTGAWRAVAGQLSRGGSAIALIPAIGITRGRVRGGDDALHNQALAQLDALGLPVAAYPVGYNEPLVPAVEAGDEWGEPLDDWMKRHAPGDGAAEFKLAPGVWRLEPLRRFGGSKRAAAGLAVGPGRVLLLPYRDTPGANDGAALRELARLLVAMPVAVPLRAHLDAPNDFDNNTFMSAQGDVWHLEPKLCAVVWAFLREERLPGDRVAEQSLKRCLVEAVRYHMKDNVGRLVAAVNRSFEAYCATNLTGVTPYALFVCEGSSVRLRFPEQFSEILGREPHVPRPRVVRRARPHSDGREPPG